MRIALRMGLFVVTSGFAPAMAQNPEQKPPDKAIEAGPPQLHKEKGGQVARFNTGGSELGPAPGLFAELTFEQACEKAKSENKVVFIDFYTTWCAPCKQLDATTFRDAKVVAWLKDKTIPLKVDAEKETELAKRYHVRSYPMLVLAKPDGTEIDVLSGYKTAEEFISEASAGLEGKTFLERAKAKLEGANSRKPRLRMEYADALVQRGKYKEALEEYLWCYDRGLEHDPYFVGVRSSFLLQKILRLKEEHPPALDALKERRDSVERSVLEGTPDKVKAAELASLNRMLNQKERTLEVYDKLRSKGPEGIARSQLLLYMVLDDLVEKKRYPEIVEGKEELLGRMATSMNNFEMAQKGAMPNAQENAMQGVKDRMIDNGAQLYEAFLGHGQSEEASNWADKLLAFDGSAATHARLIEAAVRASANDAARGIVERARQKLTGDDLKRVEEAAAKIPKEE